MKRIISFFRSPVLLALIAFFAFSVTLTAQDTITPGTPIEGTYTGDEISYEIEASAGQLIIINLESEAFDTRVGLSSDGIEVASDDDSGEGTNSLLAYVVQEDGTYFIVVSAFFFDMDEGAFTLNVDVIDPVVAEVDTPITLEPDAEGSMHLYAVFEGVAGDVVDVWAGSVSEEEDVRIDLRNTQSVSIETDDDDGPGDDALLRRIVLPEDGIYLIDMMNSRSDTPLLEGVELSVNSTEQLFLSPEPQEMILGDGEGQHGTEVFTIDVEAGVTYSFFVAIESMPDEDVGLSIELLDTEFFFDPELDTMHMTAVAWSWLSNTTGQIRLNVHPNFFGTDIEVINYRISMEVEQ